MANEKQVLTNCQRLIDPSVIIRDLTAMKSMYDAIALDGIIKALKEAPTVDAVEVVHGRWIDDGGLDEDGNGQYRCSRCGVGEKHNPTVPVSYCWNCGAVMDGERREGE